LIITYIWILLANLQRYKVQVIEIVQNKNNKKQESPMNLLD